MKILDRLPIPQADTHVSVGAEVVRLKKHQIIVWVSLTIESAALWRPSALRFPAIVDTGHTHNFAIQNKHIVRWAGIDSERIRPIGLVRHAGNRIPLHAVRVWLYRNQRGTSAVANDEPLYLNLPDGIAIFPDSREYPRLPLLGLRAILGNNLHLTVDGAQASANLRTSDWRTRFLSWLA
jgi:hypothetical protein